MHYLANQLVGPVAALGEYQNWLSLAFVVILFAVADFFMFRYLFKRSFVYVFTVVMEFAVVMLWLFGLSWASLIVGMALSIGIIAFFLSNINETRTLTNNNLKGKSSIHLFKSKKKGAESLFDRDEVYGKVEQAVKTLSRQKVGAIITFEKKDSLSDIMKSGTAINAPVSAELLQTIFYPGTRLHDGAVVIRDNMIVAASVYYTPTTRPLTGKFGSRHRAAIGISEIVDAVTVVVSEETGRISIAYQGELETVGPDTFLEKFEEYMNQVSIEGSEE